MKFKFSNFVMEIWKITQRPNYVQHLKFCMKAFKESEEW